MSHSPFDGHSLFQASDRSMHGSSFSINHPANLVSRLANSQIMARAQASVCMEPGFYMMTGPACQAEQPAALNAASAQGTARRLHTAYPTACSSISGCCGASVAASLSHVTSRAISLLDAIHNDDPTLCQSNLPHALKILG